MTEDDAGIWLFFGFFALALLAALVVAWGIYWIYRAKLLQREERREMIERGMTPPPPQPMGWPAVRAREQELKFEERRLRIEKGLEVLEDPPPPPGATLRKGLILIGFGLGLAGAYIIFNNSGINHSDEARNWFLFFGVISPIIGFIGAALVLFYVLTNRRGERT
ncbi:MAG: DUF6249 domain-containing protein [Vicinamibacterales bacterium]